MKHVKIFEQFVNEAKYSSSDLKKLRDFAEEVADEIYWEYEDDFDRKSRDLDPEDYTADAMYDYILDWGNGDPVKKIMKEFDWKTLTFELGLA